MNPENQKHKTMDSGISMMTTQRLEQILKNGESYNIEYKTCRNKLSGSVFETVCSFSNRYGGFILLGVNDDGTVMGVEPDAVEHIKKDFINSLNNPNKIRPSMFLNLEEAEYDGKTILWVYVPVNSELQFCDNKVFDRNGDADQDITKSVDLVANIINRKSNTFYEREIYPYVTTDHLRMDLIPKVKRLAILKNDRHPWKDMDEMQLFRSAGLYEENLMTGKKGFNLAAILLFGKDETILSCLPTYKTDAIFRDKNPDRYDDRLIVETNLIESYDLLMEFVQKHTDDRFFLIDNRASSVRDKIAREVIVNTLAHREYSSAFPAKLIITPSELYTENWNKSATFGQLTPQNFTPYPKNPLIARFFVNIGFADSLGSGVRNLYEFSKIYSGTEPKIEEGDVFKTTVKLYDKNADGSQNHTENHTESAQNHTENHTESAQNHTENHTDSSQKMADGSHKSSQKTVDGSQKSSQKTSDSSQKIITLILNNSIITTQEMANQLGISRRAVAKIIAKLQQNGTIRRVGPDKGGHWIVFPNNPSDLTNIDTTE